MLILLISFEKKIQTFVHEFNFGALILEGNRTDGYIIIIIIRNPQNQTEYNYEKLNLTIMVNS